MGQADYKLIVAPGAFDNMGKVLKDLGYKYEERGLDSLTNTSYLQGCRVVFVACSATLSDSGQVAENLRRFVQKGGALYVSDLSFSVIDQLFPGVVQFGHVGYDEHITGEIVDPGLREIVGKSIKLHMDYTAAAGIESVSEKVQVLIEGKRSQYEEEKFPFLISFNVGEGQVIYTVFHNSEQVSETEKKLLNYLVFRPIMSGAATKAAQLVQAQMATPGKEIFASINPGETSTRYGINVSSPITVLFVLSWEENASLGLQVWDPAGKLAKESSNNKSPLTIEIPASQTGTWTCAVKGLTLPHRNFPYVLTIATRGGKVAPAAPAVLPTTSPAVQTTLPAKHLPVHLVVDASGKASDVLNPLTTGLRLFADRLRARPVRGYAPSISLQLANDNGQGSIPLTEAGRYTTPALTARGKCRLGLALNNLLASISATPPGIKPLIIVLLATQPDDDWLNKADQLRSLAVQGKCNVFVFGLGGYSDSSVLQRLSPTAPLTLPVVTQVYAQQTFEWLYQIADLILSGLESGGSGQRKNVPPAPPCLRTRS